MPFFDSPGRCIYCAATDGLTDEHIIPASLGGKLVLADSSCPTCQSITGRFEEIVTRNMYWPLRLSLGIRSNRKRKKKAPTHWRGIVVCDETGQEEPFEIEVGKFPRFYVTVEMPPPGIINDLPPTDKSPELKVFLKADPEALKAFVESLGASSYEIGFNWRWDAFNQLLAKIAHAYSAGLVGFGGVQYLLPPLIVGGSPNFSHLIGGIDDPSHELEPPLDIQLNYRRIGCELYLCVRTTIFGNKRFPTYEIISGRITDPDLVARRIALSRQGT